jgi:hypothetical protein
MICMEENNERVEPIYTTGICSTNNPKNVVGMYSHRGMPDNYAHPTPHIHTHHTTHHIYHTHHTSYTPHTTHTTHHTTYTTY